MKELTPEIELTEEQAEAIGRGLFAVAKADGNVHPAEAALITEFYASTTENPATLGSLERESQIQGGQLADLLPGQDLRELFLKTALLLAYADGVYADGEKKLVSEYAHSLGVDDAGLTAMEQDVKEFLLAQLSHLENTEAATEVAKALKV